ncbi:VOC family protein [Marinomonas transparens]|uniref:VOC family protein n=1 Tax=Marinomonas transparens TaxID=2795388 RepID=A0A934JSV9_9GAMM|nr:VOC family protein [Marinomonas transparens]MBJ7539298.1 VOC family protein [Marinomonas transparens]
MELDHLFIAVQHPKQADVFEQLGFTEASANQHLGQGTANRRFFFNNAFIEFLYLTNKDEACSELTTPTLLFERLTSDATNVSPFGICFRPSQAQEKLSFTAWDYHPSYLPANYSVQISYAPISEPMWFYLAFSKRPDQTPEERAQPLLHSCGVKNLTHTKLICSSITSDAAQQANALQELSLKQGDTPLLELTFDHNQQNKTLDCRPTLPLIIKC